MATYLLTFFIWFCGFIPFAFGQITETDSTFITENSNEHPAPHHGVEEASKESEMTSNPANDSFDSAMDLEQKHPDNFQIKFINMLVVLALIIGFMVVASWMLKRMMRTRTTQMNEMSAIKVLETRYLSPKSTLYLLEIRGKGLVVAETSSGVSSLMTISLPEHSENSPPHFIDDKNVQ